MAELNKQLVAIGKAEQIALLRTFGAKTFLVENEDSLKSIIKELENDIDSYGTIFITSDTFQGEKNIKKLLSLGIPVLAIPTENSAAGVAHKNMENLVNKAVGMSLDFLK